MMLYEEGQRVAGLDTRIGWTGGYEPAVADQLPTLVFIHGVGNGVDAWDRVLAALPAGWRTVRYSLRGHGASDHPPGPYTLDDFVSDHNELVGQLGLGRYHLIGCSLGGLVAQGVALSKPQNLDRLILISSIAGRTPSQREAAWERLNALEAAGGPAGLAAESGQRWFTPQFARAHPEIVQERLEKYKKNDAATYLSSYRVLVENDLIDELPKIANETFAVTGEFDIGSAPEMTHNIVARVPRSAARIVPGQKHQLLIEKPELMATLISRFAMEGIEGIERDDMKQNEKFEIGAQIRRDVLGDGYVDKALQTSNEWEAEFQEFITEYCWGSIWGDDRLTRRERSLFVIAATGAMGRDAELKLHIKGALNNGITVNELAVAIKQLVVYAGVPAGVSAMRVLKDVLDEGVPEASANSGGTDKPVE